MPHLTRYIWVVFCLACATNKPKGPEPEPEKNTGLTGFEETRWGMTSEELKQRYPGGTFTGDGVLLMGHYHARGASMMLKLENDALVAIDLTLQRFPSMDACGVDWAKLRDELKETLGNCQTDNLAAYWVHPERDVTLSCDPEAEGGAAIMTARFRPHVEE